MLRRLMYDWERKLMQRATNRVVRPFEWGIDFLSDEWEETENGHKGDEGAKDILFRFNERVVAESDKFFGSVKVPEFSFDGHWLSFESALLTPYEENNTVYGRYFPVSGRDEAARARGRAVIVMPQWNSDIEGHVALCRWLNRIGIAALRLSLPYHDRRMPAGLERADYMASANIGRTLQSCRQAVLDARAAIDWLKSRGYYRIGIMGTSIGSCIGFLAFVHDERLRAGVFNHVSSYFGDVVWDGLTTEHVKRSLETALTREEARRVWLAISPVSYVSRLANDSRRALLISARYDLTFTFELSQLLFDECDRQDVLLDRAVLPWGHYTMGEAPFKYYAGYLILNYFRKHL